MQSLVGTGERFIPFKRFERYSLIPNVLMSYPGLSHGAKLVWARLAQYAGKDGCAFPSVKSLGEGVGLKKRQTQQYLSELERKGFIQREPGLRTNAYYFLLHPVLKAGVRDCASSDAESCALPMRDVAPKETKKEAQRKETTLVEVCRRDSFSDLSEEVRKYIDLKTAHAKITGRINTSETIYRAGLIRLAKTGALDISGLNELERMKREASLAQNKQVDGLLVTPERISQYLRADGRSPLDILKMIEKQREERVDRFWGLPIEEVATTLKEMTHEVSAS